MQKTIKLGSAEITVRTAQTVRDELNANLISQRVQNIERAMNPNAGGYYDLFGNLCAHVTNSKGLAFDPTALADGTAQEAYDAYDCFLNMNKKQKNSWVDACNEVDSDDVDPATSPVKLSEDADPNS